jgi:hypothetical protein
MDQVKQPALMSVPLIRVRVLDQDGIAEPYADLSMAWVYQDHGYGDRRIKANNIGEISIDMKAMSKYWNDPYKYSHYKYKFVEVGSEDDKYAEK